MAGETPEAIIQVFRKGTRFYATLKAETPYGPLTRTGLYVGKATSPATAVDEVLAMVRRLATRDPSKRGPKPRGYRHCKYFVNGV